MKVYGADFSGAQQPRNICYVEGELDRDLLTITQMTHCDDRLDLFAAIVHSRAPWGLDFPFALTRQIYEWLGVAGWEGLLAQVARMHRYEFREIHLGHQEGKCREPGIYCRYTDVAVNAYSAMKQHNPNMRGMTYGGLKLLAHLRQANVQVYPFDAYDGDAARVYEVYPSHTWKQVGLPRGMDMQRFADHFNRLEAVPLQVRLEWETVENQDMADSVVACVTTAAALSGLEPGWDICPPAVTAAEWQHRHDEGLIIRF
jgi:hypothetical protein